MSTRSNGGIIGPQNRTTSAFANGVWHLYDNQQSVLSRNWPGFIPTVPGPPNLSNVTFGTGTQAAYLTATIPFSLNVNNGGNAVTSVTAVSIPGGLSASTAGTSPITIANLTANTNYVFQVYETNYYGNSPVVFTNPATTAGVPGAPTIGTVTLYNNLYVNVAFTAPASNGGAPITSYSVISTPGNVTATGATSPITVGPLSASTSYTFKANATNIMGTGGYSASSNSITTNNVISATYLAVGGGGGGGGSYQGGGGGAGGLLTGTATLTPGTTYTISAGAAGALGAGTAGGLGGNSTITGSGLTTIDAFGGGGGGSGTTGSYVGATSGGSGGGAGGTSGGFAGASGTSGQGNAGGSSTGGAAYSEGGGGGAGAVGQAGQTLKGGDGGVGLVSTIITTSQATANNIGQVSGGSVYFAGGGGGPQYNTANIGYGGLGGGGNAGIGSSFAPQNGLQSTGGGGGGYEIRGPGNTGSNSNGGAGGTGVVMISSTSTAVATTGSPIVLTNGGNTVYIWANGTTGTIKY